MSDSSLPSQLILHCHRGLTQPTDRPSSACLQRSLFLTDGLLHLCPHPHVPLLRRAERCRQAGRGGAWSLVVFSRGAAELLQLSIEMS